MPFFSYRTAMNPYARRQPCGWYRNSHCSSASVGVNKNNKDGEHDYREEDAKVSFIARPPDRTWWDYAIIIWQEHTSLNLQFTGRSGNRGIRNRNPWRYFPPYHWRSFFRKDAGPSFGGTSGEFLSRSMRIAALIPRVFSRAYCSAETL